MNLKPCFALPQVGDETQPQFHPHAERDYSNPLNIGSNAFSPDIAVSTSLEVFPISHTENVTAGIYMVLRVST